MAYEELTRQLFWDKFAFIFLKPELRIFNFFITFWVKISLNASCFWFLSTFRWCFIFTSNLLKPFCSWPKAAVKRATTCAGRMAGVVQLTETRAELCLQCFRLHVSLSIYRMLSVVDEWVEGKTYNIAMWSALSLFSYSAHVLRRWDQATEDYGGADYM